MMRTKRTPEVLTINSGSETVASFLARGGQIVRVRPCNRYVKASGVVRVNPTRNMSNRWNERRNVGA